MNIFKGIDLSDSFVLSWSQKENELIFNIEASIWPESKHYQEPKTDEYTCYKSACIIFKNTSKIIGLLKMDEVKPSIDGNDETDYGNIDSLELIGGNYLIEGDFGNVTISGGEIQFEIQST